MIIQDTVLILKKIAVGIIDHRYLKTFGAGHDQSCETPGYSTYGQTPSHDYAATGPVLYQLYVGE